MVDFYGLESLEDLAMGEQLESREELHKHPARIQMNEVIYYTGAPTCFCLGLHEKYGLDGIK